MFENEAERKIREAIEKGELDDYKGKGEPFPDSFWLEDPFVPADLRQSYKIFKNASIVPAEIILKRRIEEIKNLLSDSNLSGSDRMALQDELIEKEVEFNVKLESFRTLSARKV